MSALDAQSQEATMETNEFDDFKAAIKKVEAIALAWIRKRLGDPTATVEFGRINQGKEGAVDITYRVMYLEDGILFPEPKQVMRMRNAATRELEDRANVSPKRQKTQEVP